MIKLRRAAYGRTELKCDPGSRGGGGHHNAVEEDAPPGKASCSKGGK